jgi:hypothetical protein
MTAHADTDTDADAETATDGRAAGGVAVTDRQLDGLVDAAGEGAEFDGFSAWHDETGYGLAVPGEEHAGLDEAAFRAAAAELPAHLTNWYTWQLSIDYPSEPDRSVGAGRHYRAFLRWLEYAPTPSTPAWEETRDVEARYEALAREAGVVRHWGDLRIAVRLDEHGGRSYEVRHVDDVDVPAAELEHHHDPLDARAIGRLDDRGRYRPLRTAPSLATGWVFPALDPRDAVETVETFYPATVANWHLERAGELDVTHWAETAERQTGIYGIVDELDAGAVDRIAASCCVDSQCHKRREWEFDDDRDLDADPGDGPFPCREPCSLVVAAARKWTTLEREEPRTYEFELTPSEKEQLEAIVDAVADDRTDEIREADVYEGANRYRARYLRAKLFDEDGNLCGTPTEPETHDDHGDHGDHDE